MHKRGLTEAIKSEIPLQMVRTYVYGEKLKAFTRNVQGEYLNKRFAKLHQIVRVVIASHLPAAAVALGRSKQKKCSMELYKELPKPAEGIERKTKIDDKHSVVMGKGK